MVHVVILNNIRRPLWSFFLYCQILSNFIKRVVQFYKSVYDYNREGDRVIYPSIDKILNIVDSKYRLVHIIGKRSKEMTQDSNFQKPIKTYISKKNLGRALEEVSEGYIVLKNDTE